MPITKTNVILEMEYAATDEDEKDIAKLSILHRIEKNLSEKERDEWEDLDSFDECSTSHQGLRSPNFIDMVECTTDNITANYESPTKSGNGSVITVDSIGSPVHAVNKTDKGLASSSDSPISIISITSSPCISPEKEHNEDKVRKKAAKRKLFNEKNNSLDDCFMGDLTLPILKRGLKKGVLTKDLVSEIILGSQRLATRVPVCVNINALFIVDLTKIGHYKDLQADGWGVWQQTSTKYHFFKLIKNTLQEIEASRYGDRNTYKVSRLSYRHSDSKDFHRVILYIKKHDGIIDDRLKKAAVQYFFEGNEHTVVVTPHGNSKQDKPFHKTFESVKQKIKEEVKGNKNPKAVVHSILEEKGGIHGIRSAGEHARNRHQITNFKYNLHDEKLDDPLLELMDICKEQAKFPSTAFIREVTASPEMTVVLATDQQLIDVERFCCNNKHFCVLGVDATYNVGQYYLTLTTYRHLLLNNAKGKHPVCIGPSLIHQRRLFDSYFTLSSGMIKLNRNIQGLLVYGSDGEKNISDSFDACYVNSTHLLCDIHMKDNVKRKLIDLGIKGDDQKLYLSEIFGRQIGGEKISGLVDCFSKSAFDEKLESLKKDWENRHEKGADFLSYFITYKADLIKNCMTADIRAMCGLGYPPAMYDQNANECVNSVIKRNLDVKKLNIKECVDHLHTLVKRQFEEIRLAMIGRGELKVDNNYSELKLAEDKYYQMTPKQKEYQDNKFFTAKVKNVDIEQGRRDFERTEYEYMSVPVENCKIINIPFTIVQDMYNKAEIILKEAAGNIVLAPGSNGRLYLVLNSQTNDLPHHVHSVGNNHQLTCDKNCIRWVAYKICSHTLAVAQHLNKLQSFLNWYISSQKGPNFTSLANADMPAGRGKKATKATKRRKGGNPNKPKETVSELLCEESVAHASEAKKSKKPALPNPQSGQFVLTLLKFCHEKTTSCFGCKGEFRSTGYPKPPGDFVVVTKGLRKFTTPAGIQQSKLGNIYFHLNNSCIAEHNSFFYRSLLTIPDDVKYLLTETHLEFLSTNNISI